MNYVSNNEQRKVFKISKKNSVSATCSKRDYSVHKCAIHSKQTNEALVKFYNLIIKHNHYLEIWIKVSHAMLEK